VSGVALPAWVNVALGGLISALVGGLTGFVADRRRWGREDALRRETQRREDVLRLQERRHQAYLRLLHATRTLFSLLTHLGTPPVEHDGAVGLHRAFEEMNAALVDVEVFGSATVRVAGEDLFRKLACPPEDLTPSVQMKYRRLLMCGDDRAELVAAVRAELGIPDEP
jgi:hypothetical protein